MNSMHPTHFGFIGFGLIGGSIAHALREIYPDCSIMAYNYYESKPHQKLEMAKKDHIITTISTDLSDFSDCEVLFLCAPVMVNVSYLTKVQPYLSKDCLITDVGSVKGNIHQAVREINLEEQFVGGHPMTGSEKTGYDNSRSAFLKDAYYILTPTEKTRKEFVEWMQSFVKACGSILMTLDEKTHDSITAGISHVPHVISAALVNEIAKLDQSGNYGKLAAGGFRDITRISSSSPAMWQNICLTNPESIVRILDEIIDSLGDIRNAITKGNEEEILQFFETAKKYRDSIL